MIYIEQITHPALNVAGGYHYTTVDQLRNENRGKDMNYVASLLYIVLRANLKMSLKYF